MGACSVVLGAILSPAGISGPAPGALIHSRSFVRSFVRSGSGGGGCDDMRRRYGATIWCDDMVRRYGATICIDDMVNRYARPENRKGQEHVAPGPDVVCFCDSLLYFCFLTHLIIFPISVGTIPAIKSWSCTRPMCSTSVSHS